MYQVKSFKRTCLAVAVSHAMMAPIQAATITVDSNLDDGTNCTLRNAIESINTAGLQGGCVASGTFGTNDTINFDLADPTIVLTNGQLEIAPTTDVSINGGASRVTIDANKNSRVFDVDNAVLTLNSMIVTQGLAPISSNGFRNLSYGGGIAAKQNSTINVNDSLITNNQAQGSNGNGGGIMVYYSTANINNSSITGNSAAQGAGIRVYGIDAVITNTTVMNNSASERGGGLFLKGTDLHIDRSSILSNSGGGIALENLYNTHISNTTVSGNSSDFIGAGGIYFGIKYFDNTSVSLTNSTITNNSSSISTGGVRVASIATNLSNNLISGNTSELTAHELSIAPSAGTVNSQNNIFGDARHSTVQALSNVTPSGSDLVATSDNMSVPLSNIIELLADNGGGTLTHALPIGSPAIGAGNLSACQAAPVNGVDQRGEARGSAQCDIGAFEGAVAQDPLGFSASVTPAIEGEDQFIILTVQLNQASQTARRIRYETIENDILTALEGVDYEARAGNIYVEPGATQKRLWFRVLDDADREGEENFTIRLTPLFGSNNPINLLATITDDDFKQAPFSVEVIHNLEGNNKFVVAKLKLNEPLTSNYNIDFFTIDGTAVDGLDYIGRSGTIFIKPGQTIKRRWFELLPDDLVEGVENFTIRFVPRQDPAISVDVPALIIDAN